MGASEPPDFPDDFDSIMEALPWSLRTRVLRVLRGDTEDEYDEPDDDDQLGVPPVEPWVDPTLEQALRGYVRPRRSGPEA